MEMNDTIVAISSPQGTGGVRAIVRLSGAGSWRAAERLMGSSAEVRPGWRDVVLGFDGVSVAGHALLFKGPRSFTGEDVAELHVPNSPALVGMMMQALLRACGVRLAEP